MAIILTNVLYSCAENYSGDRCEITDTVDTSRNSCGRSSFSTATEAENSEIFIALMSTSVMCVILIIAVIILSFRVWRLSSGRSRFKRRVIKGKNYRPAAERVINIEDCCNMNICETVRYLLIWILWFPTFSLILWKSLCWISSFHSLLAVHWTAIWCVISGPMERQSQFT